MQRPGSGRRISAAAQCLAVQRDQVGCIGTQRRRPGDEAVLEESRVDSVQDDAQPVLLRDAEEVFGVPPQEIQVVVAPGRDLVIVVAGGDRRAGDEEQNLAQRILHLRRLPRIDGGTGDICPGSQTYA